MKTNISSFPHQLALVQSRGCTRIGYTDADGNTHDALESVSKGDFPPGLNLAEVEFIGELNYTNGEAADIAMKHAMTKVHHFLEVSPQRIAMHRPIAAEIQLHNDIKTATLRYTLMLVDALKAAETSANQAA